MKRSWMFYALSTPLWGVCDFKDLLLAISWNHLCWFLPFCCSVSGSIKLFWIISLLCSLKGTHKLHFWPSEKQGDCPLEVATVLLHVWCLSLIRNSQSVRWWASKSMKTVMALSLKRCHHNSFHGWWRDYGESWERTGLFKMKQYLEHEQEQSVQNRSLRRQGACSDIAGMWRELSWDEKTPSIAQNK